MIILVMGPQGSGKSTQGQLLADKYDLSFISVGKVLRTLKDKADPVGIKAAKYWLEGELVPDKLIRDVIERFFKTHDVSKGFVMDGFPRSLLQYRWINEVFPFPVDAVVYIHLDHEEIMARLDKRRGIENRPDESPEVIAERLKNYEEDTIPVIQEFAIQSVPFIKVDGKQDIGEIHRQIVRELEYQLSLNKAKHR